MTPACSRILASLSTARMVCKTAIRVVGETIHTFALYDFSTTSVKLA